MALGVSVEGPLLGFQGLVEHDHRPIAARCRWVQAARVPRVQARRDLSVLDTFHGRRQYSRLLAAMPPIPWTADVDSHLELVHGHIHHCLRAICPPLRKLARSPVTSERTWELIRSRRALRREIFAASRGHGFGILRRCFRAWQTGVAPVSRDSHLAGLHSALLVLQLRAHNRLIRDSAIQDAADATRDIFATAHDRGPEALHRLFRSVVKAGRRYRRPSLAPAILQEDGSVAADSFRLLGDHFAEAERAVHKMPQDIVTTALDEPSSPLQAVRELSLPALAQAFGKLARKKSQRPFRCASGSLASSTCLSSSLLFEPPSKDADSGSDASALARWQGGCHREAFQAPWTVVLLAFHLAARGGRQGSRPRNSALSVKKL